MWSLGYMRLDDLMTLLGAAGLESGVVVTKATALQEQLQEAAEGLYGKAQAEFEGAQTEFEAAMAIARQRLQERKEAAFQLEKRADGASSRAVTIAEALKAFLRAEKATKAADAEADDVLD
jgi:hypothetical protein